MFLRRRSDESNSIIPGGENSALAVRGESPASTETVPAPAGQGAMGAHTRSMCPNRNAVRACAGTVECRDDFCHGLLGLGPSGNTKQEKLTRPLQEGSGTNRYLFRDLRSVVALGIPQTASTAANAAAKPHLWPYSVLPPNRLYRIPALLAAHEACHHIRVMVEEQ